MSMEKYFNRNLSPDMEKIIKKIEEKSELEIEAGNLPGAVAQKLRAKGEAELADRVEKGEINLEVDKLIFIQTGEAAKKSKEKEGESFDPMLHLDLRANIAAEKLIEMKNQKAAA